MKSKVCTKCNEEKPLSGFRKNGDRHRAQCAACCRKREKKYRQSKGPLFPAWRNMHERCYNPNNNRYSRYGERGIIVCEEWKTMSGFEQFCSDMGPRPSPKHALDRINNDGNYSPDNCRWTTPAENNRNSSKAILTPTDVKHIRFLFATTPLKQSEIARIFGVKDSTIYNIRKGRAWKDV